jgi:hypothetical protein
MIKGLIGFVVMASMVLAAGLASAADPQYVGASKCKTCHKKELIGDQYGKWQDAKHSGAFETLKGEKAIALAKEKGVSGAPSEAKECLKCHMTAYGEDASKFAKKPLDASDGVQCESCHGPGSLYKKKKTMADHDKSVAAGMWEPNEKTCTGCHNDESPSFAGFNYEEAFEKIKHPIPADVKGKYIEVEKKLKEEKKAAE